MALKFLNKKGWHTGSLRNIENVWKAEQKHNAEEKKLDELRKQIQEERERSDFRRLQEQAGLVPRQERLDFLYESGLAVGKTSEGFRDLAAPAPAPAVAAADAPAPQAAVPGALFEDKPQSANDAWRKLHTDPLLLIRQREKEALDRIKNNPMKMAMIRKSVEADKKDKHGKKDKLEKDRKRKHKSKHSSEVMSDSEERTEYEKNSKNKHSTSERNQHKLKKKKHSSGSKSDSEDFSERNQHRSKKKQHSSGSKPESEDFSERNQHRSKKKKHSSGLKSDSEDFSEGDREGKKRDSTNHSKPTHPREGERTSEYRLDSKHSGGGDEDRREGKHTYSEYRSDSKHMSGGHEDRREGKRTNSDRHGEEKRKSYLPVSDIPVEKISSATQKHDNGRPYGYNRRQNVPKLSEEERASRLREMQIDAELHEEQRWKRMKKAADADAHEANTAGPSGGKNFLDAAQRSIYGTEKGGSSTIEESVRRRAYYSQGGSADHESNAFRR